MAVELQSCMDVLRMNGWWAMVVLGAMVPVIGQIMRQTDLRVDTDDPQAASSL